MTIETDLWSDPDFVRDEREANPPELKRTCEALVGYVPRPKGWGVVPIRCTQRVGLVSFQDRAGKVRHHCHCEGHRYDVQRRYGLSAAR